LVKVAVPYGDGEVLYNVVMLFDRETGTSWWLHQQTYSKAPSFEEFSLPFLLYFTDHAAVGFRFMDAHLAVREVVSRPRDLAGVERLALADLRETMLAGDWSRHFIKVDVSDSLRDFRHRRTASGHYAAMSSPPNVFAVTHAEDLWHVTLKGPNNDFAEMVLDNRYDLKDIKLRPSN
jgi:hypothetical protein